MHKINFTSEHYIGLYHKIVVCSLHATIQILCRIIILVAGLGLVSAKKIRDQKVRDQDQDQDQRVRDQDRDQDQASWS